MKIQYRPYNRFQVYDAVLKRLTQLQDGVEGAPRIVDVTLSVTINDTPFLAFEEVYNENEGTEKKIEADVTVDWVAMNNPNHVGARESYEAVVFVANHAHDHSLRFGFDMEDAQQVEAAAERIAQFLHTKFTTA